jgi:carboxyl-terminal processing protease
MKRRTAYARIRTALKALAFGGLVIAATGFVDEYFEVSRNIDIFNSLYRQVNRYYVDTVDAGRLMQAGIDAMLSTLDPYTRYIPESKAEDYRFVTTGTYGGIGASIRLKGDYVCLLEPYEGFPAQQAGLQAGDLIVAVDSLPMTGKSSDEVSHALKGKPGTFVTLTVDRGGKRITETLTREEIKIPNVPYAGLLQDGIGYIRLSGFTDRAGREVRTAMKDLLKEERLTGVVLDLRGNPGGLLHEAINVANVFVPKGVEVVHTRGRMKEWNKVYLTLDDAVDDSIPLVVLVNSGSASAAEIVAGALQDLDRAVVIGQRTYGKGLVQITRPLSYNTQVKMTSSRYYIPSGRCIQALDYSHRNPDGSVGKIPDSLITAFRTLAGRPVFDGGGILPDIVMPSSAASGVMAGLLGRMLIFDFATAYHATHDSIGPVGQFEAGSAEYAAFRKFLAERAYSDSSSGRRELEAFHRAAESEKVLDLLRPEYTALKRKMETSGNAQLDAAEEEIRDRLGEEICSRYGWQRGRILASLRHDPTLRKAIGVLTQPGEAASILNGTFDAGDQTK